MEQEQKTKYIGILKKALIAVFAVIAVIIIFIFARFGNLILTIFDIKQVDDKPFFTMEYHGDYGFDEFLKIGASTDRELVDFIIKELTHGIPLKFELPDLGCSTFVSKNSEGDTVFGRNFDMYDSPALLVKTTPKNGYRSLSMVNLAYVGYNSENLPIKVKNRILALTAPYVPLDGINEKGLAISVMLIDTEPTNQQTEKVDITTTTAIRLVLDKAATTNEAIELLKKYDMHSSANSCYHFLIADKNGDSAVVEYVNNEISILPGEKISTNFLLTPGEYDFGAGYDRFEIIETELEKVNGITDNAMDILNACKQLEKPDKRSSTQWSCVYNLDDLNVDVSIKMDYDKIYSFSLN